MSQLSLVPGEHPDRLIERACAEHCPIARVCLISGGHDSTVLAHRCRDRYEELAFIDTGTAIPGVAEFVAEYAAWLGKPLRVLEAGDAYRRMVLGAEEWWEIFGRRRVPGETVEEFIARTTALPSRDERMAMGVHLAPLGFPGPGQHGRSYTRLKERQIERLLRDLKTGHARNSRALFITGVRRGESARRSKRAPLTRKASAAFCNPLIDWSNQDMRAYRETHGLPESDVSALLHKSGECNCGAFAAPGEREELQSLWPGWFDSTIGALEREAEARGIAACRWGSRPADQAPADEAGALCTDCQLRLEAA